MTFTVYSFFIVLVISWITSTSRADTAIGCFSSEATYSLCIVNETDTVVVSKTFSGDLLADECHVHFMEDVFDETCPEVTTEAAATTAASETDVPTTAQRFGYGFLAVFVISVLSLVGLAAVPCIKKSVFQYVLAFFTALAVGTLFGDTMFHLIPFTFGLHGHEAEEATTIATEHNHASKRAVDSHDHSSIHVPVYQWRAFTAVMVLYGFYLLEVFLHWLMGLCSDKNTVHTHHHGHSHTMNFTRSFQTEPVKHLHSDIENAGLELTEYIRNKNKQRSLASRQSNVQDQVDESADNPKISRATGWMVILGDGIHNFADGLAIGAAFSQSLMIGLTTTIAVGCHEVPHELGDYAVLLQAGFSRCSALLWNFVSATTAIIGFFVGAAVSTNESVRQWIFAVTVGMFLYIALVDLLPTLLPHGRVQIRRFICVNLGFLLGIAIMFILAIFEDKLIHAGS